MSTTFRRHARSEYQRALTSVYQLNHEFNMKAGAMLPFLLGVQVCFFTNVAPPYWCEDIFM